MSEELEFLEVRPQTTISYSRTYNLVNYENEKLFISLLVEDNETPQQTMIRARAMVDEMHNQFQTERERASKLEWARNDIERYQYSISEQRAHLAKSNWPIPDSERPVSEVDPNDELAVLVAERDALQAEYNTLQQEIAKLRNAEWEARQAQLKASQGQDDDDDKDYEEDGEIDL